MSIYHLGMKNISRKTNSNFFGWVAYVNGERVRDPRVVKFSIEQTKKKLLQLVLFYARVHQIVGKIRTFYGEMYLNTIQNQRLDLRKHSMELCQSS